MCAADRKKCIHKKATREEVQIFEIGM